MPRASDGAAYHRCDHHYEEQEREDKASAASSVKRQRLCGGVMGKVFFRLLEISVCSVCRYMGGGSAVRCEESGVDVAFL